MYIPYAEIEEPFEAWFDKHTNRSRIDYYGGTVKTYQLSHEGQFGTSLKIAPVTTDEEPNKLTCLQVNGTSEMRVEPQAILPDCREFQLAGKSFYWIQLNNFRNIFLIFHKSMNFFQFKPK